MFDIKQWIYNNIPKNGIIIEAGTADGSDTIDFLNHIKDGYLYGFEPYTPFFEITKEKVKKFSNVEIYNSALSDKSGTATFHISDHSGNLWGSSSLLPPKDHLNIHPAITFKSTNEVNTINLDEWASDKNINRIDLMWLDMQGAEPFVLKNAINILKKTKYLYTEVSLIETYSGVTLYPEFKSFLNSHGFEVIFEDCPYVDMGNVLFINKHLP